MRRILALVKAQWRTLLSYRVQSLFSLAGMLLSVVPLFFIARAVEPVMAGSIAKEGGNAFGFLLIGTLGLMVMSVAINTLPTAIGSGISSGTFEALIATPTRTSVLVVGLSAFPLLEATCRAGILLVAGWALGTHLALAHAPIALLVVLLLILAHFAIGLFCAAMILTFRTAGPIPRLVVLASIFLGGVYYPTQVIPSWLQSFSALLPVSYGLRALRRLLLQDAPFAVVAPDLLALFLLASLLLAGGAGAFTLALRQARRQGTLTQY